MTSETRLERGRRMLDRIDGEAGRPVINALEDIAPEFATDLFEDLFGDTISDPGLNLRERESTTSAAENERRYGKFSGGILKIRRDFGAADLVPAMRKATRCLRVDFV